MLKKYQLNEFFWLEICEQFDKGALNGIDFEAMKEWVLAENVAERWNVQYVYTTIAANRFNLKFKFDKPKTAIQQILEYAYTGKETKLKNMWFRIIEKQN